jgi:hypothetical protein
LKEIGYDHQIKVIDNATHEITMEDFENFFNDFYSVYKDFKHPDFYQSKPKPKKKSYGDVWEPDPQSTIEEARLSEDIEDPNPVDPGDGQEDDAPVNEPQLDDIRVQQVTMTIEDVQRIERQRREGIRPGVYRDDIFRDYRTVRVRL